MTLLEPEATAAVGCPFAAGPEGIPLMGNTLDYAQDPAGFTRRVQRSHGNMVPLRLVPYRAVQITDADAIRRVLVTNVDNYARGRFYRAFQLFMGRGLLTMDDQSWKADRRLLADLFSPTRMAEYEQWIVTATERVLAGWASHARTGQEFDLVQEMMSATARVLGEVLLGEDLSRPDDRFSEAVTVALQAIFNNVGSPHKLVPAFVPTRYNRRVRWARRTLDGIIDRAVARRAGGEVPERGAGQRPDALGLMLAAGLPHRAIGDHLRTFFLAGAETTGLVLAWTLYELARHPDARRRMEEEVDRVLAGRTPTLADAADLVFTRMVVDEGLRMYPPVWQFPRDAIADDLLAGRHLPAGSSVLVEVHATHRNPEYWADPEAFDPDRFSPEVSAGRPRHAYLPFGAGRRQCIGRSLGLASLQLTVAMVTQRYRVTLCGGSPVSVAAHTTLFPAAGIPVSVRERR